ncbi:prolipoprotein diacylglyceryl transferase [Palleronia sp. KMU-117]|uniref:prolipoprotein diacylglyceryl transferase n=1 Tax=Palleronia sp. KMU-117 TaxID=3434108 RepID=UPI003D7491E3
MLFAIPFPEISPELFSIEIGDFTFALRWYALAYIAAVLVGWTIITRAVKTPRLFLNEAPTMTPQQVEEMVTGIIVGIIVGGRLGFVLFYQPAYYLANPLEILKVWQGGMSFHGGFLGVVVAGLLFCRRHGLSILGVGDLLALGTPLGLMFGRLSNFINGELWGRPTDLPWGVIFPGPRAQDCPGVIEGFCARHPSQLYQAGLEGLALALVLFWLVWRRGWLKTPGAVMGMFLAGYGAARFFVEFFRVADEQFITPGNPLGHVLSLGPLGVTMGQLLSLPMIAAGLWLIARARPGGRTKAA